MRVRLGYSLRHIVVAIEWLFRAVQASAGQAGTMDSLPSQAPSSARRNSRYIVGTKISVAKVANSSPPMTARASGAFCSPPSPTPKAIGIMPRIIAPAVISTGRSRV